ncbi:membrane protein [Streptomyces viridochromogenes]|uniref:Membrane protein n=1 Tax=Streptomyces viridochromogenes TaxID=1938 RepID=A0A0J7Z771_STRVR|nr:PH domain-containing protein [Streptomyces viridochromogenes]KMS70998.1 membrane protein [Streptomyces viridochromogenes]KOG18538.1 membrane protein [Streptomyces viridochromogenes]KOG23457.1 membrane protein [Streptomyces viridochromogenes]
MSSELPTLPVTFRPGRTRAVLLTAGAAIFVVITAVALLLEKLGPGERLSFIFTGALMFGVLAMLARVKVVADDSGVTVVNIASRRRLEWAEIVQVNLRPGDPWVFLNLSDGTSLPALGIQPGIAKQRAIADARTLRALTEARVVKDPEERQD